MDLDNSEFNLVLGVGYCHGGHRLPEGYPHFRCADDFLVPVYRVRRCDLPLNSSSKVNR